MQEAVIDPSAPALSEPQRIVDTFVAPGKTFADIRRSATWWGPVLLMILASVFFSYAVDKKVGFDAVAHQQIAKVPAAAERIDALPPDVRAEQYQKATVRTRYQTYGFVFLGLIFVSIVSLLWWLSLNFGLGADARYSQVFAVMMYAGLPKLFIYLLAAVLLFAGVGIDGFDIQNPAGTNLGYYLPESMPALRAAGSFIDFFGLWALALGVFGTAIITGKKPSQTAVVVVGWWVFGMLLVTGLAAAFS